MRFGSKVLIFTLVVALLAVPAAFAGPGGHGKGKPAWAGGGGGHGKPAWAGQGKGKDKINVEADKQKGKGAHGKKQAKEADKVCRRLSLDRFRADFADRCLSESGEVADEEEQEEEAQEEGQEQGELDLSQLELNPAWTCKVERFLDPEAFLDYSTNGGPNAFGKCVSLEAHERDGIADEFTEADPEADPEECPEEGTFEEGASEESAETTEDVGESDEESGESDEEAAEVTTDECPSEEESPAETEESGEGDDTSNEEGEGEETEAEEGDEDASEASAVARFLVAFLRL